MRSLALAIATKGEWDAERLLQTLRSAGVDASAEIHVACDPEHAPAQAPEGLSVHSKAGASLFDLWALAIAQSGAEWVAILHADALPAPGWFAAMNEAIGRDAWPDGYMGPVEPAFSAPSDPRMIGYLTEYVQFHRPWDPALKEIPGNNLVLPRWRIGVTADFSKTRLLEQGLAPKLVEDAVVLYARWFRLGDYCVRRFRHGRAYAANRALSPFVGVPLSLALPFIRTARVLRHTWRHKKLRFFALLLESWILLVESFWSAGELIGYATRRPGDPSKLD